ncbi:MAG: DUF87 domain-containing protein [Candidatus Bathyarchaeia archaeon]
MPFDRIVNTGQLIMQDFDKLGVFYLGRLYDVANKTGLKDLLLYDSKDLVTHAVCIGMTGSGKTGLCLSLIEEAATDGVPTIAIDPKGDITNLLLTFPDLESKDFEPWINQEDAAKKGLSPQEYAKQQADLWKNGLSKWGQDGKRIQRLRDSAEFVIYTPGSTAGLPISILKSFSAPPLEIREDSELLHESINTTVTGLLSLLGITADALRSREHILLSTIFSEAWTKGEDIDLARLIQLIQNPPVTKIGVLDLESFYSSKDRFTLAMQLNNLLAAPGFSLWLEGESLNIQNLFYSKTGKPKVSIFYISHLSDSQRMFFVSLLLNQIVGWMRTQSGTTSLRSLLYIDEVFGYLPPVANPPSKLPLLTLLKQARAFGLGVVLATQNPIDLDYKALSNTGTWFLGRLQTERDKERVLDGLEGASISGQKQFNRRVLSQMLSGLGNRVFLMNNVHEDEPVTFETRWAMSYLRGPLTRDQIKTVMEPVKIQNKTSITPKSSDLSSKIIVTQTTKKTVSKPIFPPGISDYYLPLTKGLNDANVIYKPMVIGAAQIRFSDTKAKINIVKDQVFIVPVKDGPIPLDWENAQNINIDLSKLTDKPPTLTHSYSEVPSAILQKNNYSLWKKDFTDWLSETQKTRLFRSPHLKEISKPEESERDFRIRLEQLVRENRDQQIEKLRKKYNTSFHRIDEKIRKAQLKLEEQNAQAKNQKYQVVASIGESLLGSFLGRKSSYGISKTTRALSRSSKESRDKKSAEENLKAAQQERKRLESQFESEVKKTETKIDVLSEVLEKVDYAPSKTGITVRLLSLVWVLD